MLEVNPKPHNCCKEHGEDRTISDEEFMAVVRKIADRDKGILDRLAKAERAERRVLMNTFYISDTHFGHKNMTEEGRDLCKRGFATVEEMNEALILNWNSVVGEEDTVYHLGDVALGPWVEWDGIMSRLNGYKILVVGNHERIFKGEKDKQVEKFTPVYRQWFDEIHDNVVGHTLPNGQVVNLSHFPYEADHMDQGRHMNFRLPDDGNVLVHGHTHLDQILSESLAGTIQVHVGADAHNFTPVSQQQLMDYIRVAQDLQPYGFTDKVI